MLKSRIENEADYYYIYGIVERFIRLFEKLEDADELTPIQLAGIKDEAKERLSTLISSDDNLSQDTSSKDFNIRILTTKGNVNIYFYSNAFDWNVPSPDPSDTLYSETEREKSCILITVKGVNYSYYHFDYQWMTHLIETVIPSICIIVCDAICSLEE